MRVGFGFHENVLRLSIQKQRARGKGVGKEVQRENKGKGEVPLLLVGFIILPLFLSCPFAFRNKGIRSKTIRNM